MKHAKILVLMCVSLFFFSHIASAQTLPAGSTSNYYLNLNSPGSSASISGVAFDQVTSSVWVTSDRFNTINKVNIYNGQVEATYSAGLNPRGLVFDAVTNSVWVANAGANTVSKINASTRTRVDYPVGTRPLSLVFDNVTNSVWVTNSSSGTVSKVDINTGTRIDYPVARIGVESLTFDSVTNSVWITNSLTNLVSKVDIFIGTKVDYPVGLHPSGVVFDNITNSVWVTNSSSSTISKIDIFTGSKVDYPAGVNPSLVIFDNSTNSVWVVNNNKPLTNSVSKIDIHTGSRTSYPIFGAIPSGMTFDPITKSIWIAYRDTNMVSKISVGEPATSTPSACTQNCYSNVLFLPGLEASRLYRPDYNGGTDQLWEPTSDADGTDLLLDANGDSVRGDVYTKDVIGVAYGILGKGNIYSSFIDQMNGLKRDGTINDWKATPYDWRLSLDDILNNGTEISGRIYYSGTLAATSSPYIIQELKRLASTSKTGKVTIVAHSNGGLVTKALIKKLGTTEAGKLIDKIIFVAVPQVGTPKALGAILHGYDQGLLTDTFSIFFSEQAARTLAQNMSSAYNLLPSASYFDTIFNSLATFEDKPILAGFRERYGESVHTGAQLKYFLTDTWRNASSTPSDIEYPSVGSEILFDRAATTHHALDAWTPPAGVELYEIAGWGEDTLVTVAYGEGKKNVCISLSFFGCVKSENVPILTYTPIEVIDGDGTVLTPSALWTATARTTGKWWVDLKGYNDDYIDRKHADILEVPDLRALIQGVITNSTSTLPVSPFIFTSQPAYDPSDPADARLSFILHSPLHLSATDSLGNITNSATTTIPSSRFTRYGEVQVLKVPKGTPITLNLEGYASGSFTLDMQELDGLNNIVASTTFSAVPSATSTTVTISFPNGTLQTATPLLVDYDGNNTTDFTLYSSIGKEVIFDTTPPEARISFSTTTKSLLIEALDETLTTVHTTATSTLITDESQNTLELTWKKLKEEKNELKLELKTLSYNGVSTSQIPKTTLQYEWSTDKQGNLKELEQKATVGSLKVEAHYDAKKNQTNIKKKLKEKHDHAHDEDKEIKETFSGLRILKLVTEKREVRVDY